MSSIDVYSLQRLWRSLPRSWSSRPECSNGQHFAPGLCGLISGAFFVCYVIFITSGSVTWGFSALVLPRYCDLPPSDYLFSFIVTILLGVVEVSVVVLFLSSGSTFRSTRRKILTSCDNFSSPLFYTRPIRRASFKIFSQGHYDWEKTSPFGFTVAETAARAVYGVLKLFSITSSIRLLRISR